MALRAGYVGIKNRIMQSLRDILPKMADIIPSGASSENQLATAADVAERVDWSSYALLGAKNQLAITLAEVKANNTTGVWNGNAYTLNGVTATFTADSVGNITNVALSNQASATTTITLKTNHVCDYILTNMILNGCAVGGSGSTFKLQIYDVTGNNAYVDFGSGIAVPSSVNGHTINVAIVIYSGNPTSNINIKPMIRLATDTDPTYAPYAMTNEELTGSVADHKTAINAIITAATGAADFAAFKTAMGAITPVTRSLSMVAAPEEITEEPVVVKKTTTKKKSTAKADTNEEE